MQADKTGKYRAVGVDDAHKVLTQRWNNAYEAISKPPTLKQLPLYSLLPGGETELLRVRAVWFMAVVERQTLIYKSSCNCILGEHDE